MRTCEENSLEDWAASNGPTARQAGLRANPLHLVTVHDFQNLRDELIRGNVPADLEAKLIKLARDNLARRSIEQNCRTIIALLQAAQQCAFKEASPEACERLLQVLAYVRKDDDAIPDYRPDGFTDDLEQIRAVGTQLGPLLRSFKAWRLRHQVPGMWVGSQTPIELSGISV